MPKLFLSYRRADNVDLTDRFYEELRGEFSEDEGNPADN